MSVCAAGVAVGTTDIRIVPFLTKPVYVSKCCVCFVGNGDVGVALVVRPP